MNMHNHITIKLFLLFITFCLIPISKVKAQDWAPIGAIWYYQYNGENCFPSFEYITYESVKDTLINSQTCRIIQGMYYNPNGDTTDLGKEIMYGDSVNVYIYTNNKFYKIYDFSAQPGDTITVIDTVFEGFCGYKDFLTYNLFEYVIDSISTYVINGDSLMQFYTSPTDSSDWWFGYPGIILEKVGFLGIGVVAPCFIGEPYPIATVGPTFGPIRCYQDQQVFYNFMGIPCDTLCTPLGISINPGKNNLLKVYPNPASSQSINLEYELNQSEEVEISIFDNFGKVVKEINDISSGFGKHTVEIDISDLPSGLYLCMLKSGNGHVVAKFSVVK